MRELSLLDRHKYRPVSDRFFSTLPSAGTLHPPFVFSTAAASAAAAWVPIPAQPRRADRPLPRRPARPGLARGRCNQPPPAQPAPAPTPAKRVAPRSGRCARQTGLRGSGGSEPGEPAYPAL